MGIAREYIKPLEFPKLGKSRKESKKERIQRIKTLIDKKYEPPNERYGYFLQEWFREDIHWLIKQAENND